LLDLAHGLPPEQRRLLKLFGALSAADREALLAFAEFLVARRSPEPIPDEAPSEPKAIPRPEEESVIAAIRRLSETYFMLDRGTMLNETSSLMAAHVMQGRPAPEVIDELEDLFAGRYETYLSQSQD
jgi:hypothetical protein